MIRICAGSCRQPITEARLKATNNSATMCVRCLEEAGDVDIHRDSSMHSRSFGTGGVLSFGDADYDDEHAGKVPTIPGHRLGDFIRHEESDPFAIARNTGHRVLSSDGRMAQGGSSAKRHKSTHE